MPDEIQEEYTPPPPERLRSLFWTVDSRLIRISPVAISGRTDDANREDGSFGWS